MFIVIDKVLVGLKFGENLDGYYVSFVCQMWLVFYVCLYYNLGIVVQFVMLLIDFFDCLYISGNLFDSILMYIGCSFVDMIELVFDVLEQGEIFDINYLDVLFEQVLNVVFFGEGLMMVMVIECWLLLLEQYYCVLLFESVCMVLVVIEVCKYFYIIFIDINDKEDMVEQFLIWIGNENVDLIINVIVFCDEDMLFEFLIVIYMEQLVVMIDLVLMDFIGKYLLFEYLLEDNVIDEDVLQENVSDVDVSLLQGQGLMIEMFESIFEVVVLQVMVNYMLFDLLDMSIVDSVEVVLKVVEQDFEKGCNVICGLVVDLFVCL